MKGLITKYSTTCLTVMVFMAAFILSSCRDRINPAPPINPHDYPSMTATKSPKTTTITEGNTITYTIKADKPLEHPTPFSLYSDSGSAESSDYSYPNDPGVTYPKFVVDTSITVPVTFTMDNLPEKTEKITYKIGIPPLSNIRLRQSISPDSKLPTETITIKNHNNPNALTVAYQWPNPNNDLDMVVFVDAANDGTHKIGVAAASLTGNDPESVMINNKKSSDGTYLFGINPYKVSGSKTDYKFRVGFPNQKVKILSGTFNVKNPSKDLSVITIKVGGTPTSFYVLLTAHKTGSDYKVTLVDSGGSSTSSARLNIEDYQVVTANGIQLHR